MRTQTFHRTFTSVVPLLALFVAMTLMQGRAMAVVTELALWKLGEPGTIVGGLPQDSVGGHHFQNNFGTQSTVTPGAPLFSSTTGNSYTPIAGSYYTAPGTTVVPTDNFAIELWARSDNANQPFADLFTTGETVGTLRFHTDPSGNWAASLDNVNWIGGAAGAGQPITVGEWTNLALIRNNGLLTFYINGIAQAGSLGTAPVIDMARAHLAVTPGGLTSFDGSLDEVRIFSFNPNTDNPVAALSIFATVPEPATATLALLGMGVLMRRRRLA